MLAIFTDEKSAVDFSQKIHNYLTINRPKYNAIRWSGIKKSDFEKRWFVKVPYDYQRWTVKLDIKEVTELIPTEDIRVFLNTWEKIEEIEPVIIKR